MKLNEVITEDDKKRVVEFADTWLGALAFGFLVICIIWILHYVLLRIAG